MPIPTPPSPRRPLVLSDSQLTELMRLAAPLQPVARDALLRILAHELSGRVNGVGDGELNRLVRETIKSYQLFDPPTLNGEDGRSHRLKRGKYW
jgi:hypothetical protein